MFASIQCKFELLTQQLRLVIGEAERSSADLVAKSEELAKDIWTKHLSSGRHDSLI